MIMPQKPSEWTECGIVGEGGFVRLAYSRSANVVVAQFHRMTLTDSILSTLYIRRPDEPQYRRLTAPSERLSYEDPIVAPSAPTLIANVLAWEGDGADWQHVICFDLSTGREVRVVRDRDISLCDPYTSAHVSSLHEPSTDGRVVVCTISFGRAANEDDKRRFREVHGADIATVDDHWLCELNLENKTYERITLLRALFF